MNLLAEKMVTCQAELSLTDHKAFKTTCLRRGISLKTLVFETLHQAAVRYDKAEKEERTRDVIRNFVRSENRRKTAQDIAQ